MSGTDYECGAAVRSIAIHSCITGKRGNHINQLRELRIGQGFTQTQLADRLEISLRTYQRIEYGDQKPNVNVVIRLQKLFRKNIDEIITVEDQELTLCFLDMIENHKMVVENSGLLTVAALKHLKAEGKKVVAVLSGGNMDVIMVSSIVQHGLIQRGRIFTVSVLLPDRPGELHRVSGLIADMQGNVIRLEHNQFVSINRNTAVELVITMEAFGQEHKQSIIQKLEQKGYRPKETQAKGAF